MKLRTMFAAHLLAAFAAAFPAAAQQDVIIESRKEGKNHDKYSEPAGSWIDSNNPPTTAKSGAADLTPQGQAGSRKFVLKEAPTGDSRTILGSARFAPQLTAPGHYYVYSTWPKASNAGPVQYAVKHAKGESLVPVTQDGFGYSGIANANQWYLLGDFDFSAGSDQYVELRATGETKSLNVNNPADIGQVFADAIRFSPKPLSEGQYITAQGPTKSSGSAARSTAQASSSSAQSAASTKRLEWLNSIEEGLTAAQQQRKKILVFFYSPEGTRSQRYEKTVFEDSAVKSLLNEKFVLVRINLLENPDLASKMRVFKAGTINIYDSRGEGVDQITESLGASELAGKLRGY